MRRSATKSAAAKTPVEQRAEPRHAAQGEVRFTFDESGSAKSSSKEIRGKLLDRSTSGFRAEHDCSELTSGQVVRFQLAASSNGKARVVWTRILCGRVETGFLIL
jgi:hypothetical protein